MNNVVRDDIDALELIFSLALLIAPASWPKVSYLDGQLDRFHTPFTGHVSFFFPSFSSFFLSFLFFASFQPMLVGSSLCVRAVAERSVRLNVDIEFHTDNKLERERERERERAS